MERFSTMIQTIRIYSELRKLFCRAKRHGKGKVRMINLFIAIEIIDQSKRLDKNSLKRLLSIDLGVAYYFAMLSFKRQS